MDSSQHRWQEEAAPNKKTVERNLLMTTPGAGFLAWTRRAERGMK